MQGNVSSVVYPLSDTSFTAFLTDGVDTVFSSVFITVNDIPTSDFIVIDPVCSGDITTITYTGTGSSSAMYAWHFDGGIIVSGTAHGPYEVFWHAIGVYDVSLSLIENNCLSPVTTVSVSVIDCASIAESDSSYIRIYPNPASDILILENQQNTGILHIKIFNLQGQLLMEKQVTESTETKIDISTLSQGMYVISIQDNKLYVVGKVVFHKEK